ncbi:MAG: hypothetical protein R2710_27940 [Acidimicrobiales bacterium]
MTTSTSGATKATIRSPGNGGNDIVFGDEGNDAVRGGNGDDTVSSGPVTTSLREAWYRHL